MQINENLNVEIQDVILVALKAGEEILKIYNKKNFEIEIKNDNSPVTEADYISNKIIVESLKELYPEIPLISEEMKNQPFEVRKNWNTVWSIDPIDGTKEFIKKNGEFSVNIALVQNGKTVLGVVYAPATEDLYFAEKNKGAYFLNLSNLDNEPKKMPFVDRNKRDYFVAFESRSNQESNTRKEFLKMLNLENSKMEYITMGSSLKGCIIATGKADFYPKMGNIKEWDTSAIQIVLEESDAQIIDIENHSISDEVSLAYNKEVLKNPHFLIKPKNFKL